MKKCKNCGYEGESKFCPECGSMMEEIIDEAVVETEDSESTTDTKPDESTIGVVVEEAIENNADVDDKSSESEASGMNLSEALNSSEIANEKASSSKPKRALSKKTKVVAGVMIAILLLVVGAITINHNNKEKHLIAITKMRGVTAMMYLNVSGDPIEGNMGCEDLINLTNSVWHDAIFEDYSDETEKYVKGSKDFQEAIEKLYEDDEIVEFIDSLPKPLDYDKGYDVPEDLEKAYDAFLEVKVAYKALIDWCEWPNSSYNDYMTISQQKYDDFWDAYNRFDELCPRKED